MNDALAGLRKALAGFLGLLEEEAAALAGGRADDLDALTARRDAANKSLAAHWRSLAANMGLPPDASLDDMRERCASLPDWAQTEDLARQAAQRNRLNSKLIDEQLRRTQAAVQVLRNAAGNRMLYGADGRMSDFPDLHRNIGSA
jgi:flagellar biosynthesis/type III secretory pathway chaperone